MAIFRLRAVIRRYNHSHICESDELSPKKQTLDPYPFPHFVQCLLVWFKYILYSSSCNLNRPEWAEWGEASDNKYVRCFCAIFDTWNLTSCTKSRPWARQRITHHLRWRLPSGLRWNRIWKHWTIHQVSLFRFQISLNNLDHYHHHHLFTCLASMT